MVTEEQELSLVKEEWGRGWKKTGRAGEVLENVEGAARRPAWTGVSGRGDVGQRWLCVKNVGSGPERGRGPTGVSVQKSS